MRKKLGKSSKKCIDYYPGGMLLPNRNVEGDYRYKFQGQEKDPETGMEAFELRLWDGRIGRWLTPDPYGQFHSPYLGMGNNPINGVDPDGGCWTTDADGNTIRCPDGKIGDMMKGDYGYNWEFRKGGWELANYDNILYIRKKGSSFSDSFSRAAGAGSGGFSLFTVKDPKMPTNLPIGIGVGYEFATPIKIPTKDYYGLGQTFGITAVDDDNDPNKIGSIRGFSTIKRADEPGFAMGINISFFMHENHLNTPLTADRFRY